MKRVLFSVVVVSALVAADGAEAQQWRPERPYRGLFAGGIGETSQLLTARASVGVGVDENLLPDLGGSGLIRSDGRFPRFRSTVGTTSAALSYSLNKGPAELGATAGTTGRYYPSLSNEFVRRDYANVGAAVGLGGGFSVYGSATYQPYSLRSIFPGLFEPSLGNPTIVDEDFPASHVHYRAYSAGADYSRRLSRRTTFTTRYEYWTRARSEVAGRYQRHHVRGRLTREVGRGLAVYAGYGYYRTLYDQDDREFSNHNVDLGVDYNRALSLSLSRRTILSFSTGTALYQDVQPESVERGPLRFRVTGAARLDHEIGRTWSASLGYNRGFSYTETWREPIFADSVVAGVGGLIGRRTQLQFSARALRGGGYSGNYGDVESVSASGGLTVALTRYVNTGLTYVYYQQRFTDDLSLAEGFPQDFSGQSIRASVSVWAPLFQRARRP